jgi:predicted nucleic acid-binding protein
MNIGLGVYLADTSAWHRSLTPTLREPWLAAVRQGAIATRSVVRLELLYSARTSAELDDIAASLAALRDVPVGISVQRAAEAAIAGRCITASRSPTP